MKTIKDITIYDLAHELQVSAATVSRALNHHPSINKNTRKKIIELASKRGYRSNTFASNLRRQHTNTIGLILHELNSQFMVTQLEPRKNLAFINLFTARLHDLVDGDHIEIESKINSMQVLVCVTEDVMNNTLCLSHGFANFENVSNLTSSDDVNPLSGMVSQTALPIEIKRI